MMKQIVGNRTSKLNAAAIPVERGDIKTVLELVSTCSEKGKASHMYFR
jgi:hypothetical protein